MVVCILSNDAKPIFQMLAELKDLVEKGLFTQVCNIRQL